MTATTTIELTHLQAGLQRLRGNAQAPVTASIVIPVNAQGDLENVLQLVADIVRYQGQHLLEVILVINNYPPNAPPVETKTYSQLGLKILSLPSVRQPGEAIGFSARVAGAQIATGEYVLLFDADCRIPNPNALIDWYIQQLSWGANVAYTHVDYYGLQAHWSIRLRMSIHHGARWMKRKLLRIPTTRGSNYAVQRTMLLGLYQIGLLADEMNVGPTFKRIGSNVAYSGDPSLRVLTSGRMINPRNLQRVFRYFKYRLFYNLRVIRVRQNMASRTGRENDPVRRYINNKLVE